MTRALCFALLMLVVAVGFAQQRSVPEYQMGTLRFAAVQEELKLTTGQRTKVLAALDLALNEYKRAAGPGIRMATVDRIYALQLKALAFLSEPQKKRLREISLQIVGPYALSDPRIAAWIGLGAAQQAKLRSTMAKMGEEARTQSDGRHGKSTAQDRAAAVRQLLQRQRNELNIKVESLMTPAQKKKWRSLNGKPFDLSRLKA